MEGREVSTSLLRRGRSKAQGALYRRLKVFCTQCGHRNPEDARFCANCGHPLQEDTTIGRHPESDIFLDDVTVSRRHAEFQRDEGKFVIHDVGSLNGTYVSRQRVDETQLANGDELQIGKFKLTFYVGE